MNAIDQHKITASWEQALVPSPTLIDGRREQDWLTFLSRYASLINFYDNNNQQKGNWSPFLLKDPVFLIASIANTRFTEIHSRYLHTCSSIERLLQSNALDTHQQEISIAFNILFEELTNIFIRIKEWIYFMRLTNDDYDLKTYTVYETKLRFSSYYWALTALQQNLFMTALIPGISPVENNKFYFFDAYEEVIWKANKSSQPYWNVLGLKNPLKENKWLDIYLAIKNTGDKVFVFFNTLIKNAGSEFEKLKNKKSRYPDTTLIRSFVYLLKFYQDQLNGISQKHLNFYYEDILKQQQRAAVPDRVYLCSSLAKSDSTFLLAAGTAFSAGLDVQKKPIMFATTADVELNPATIKGGFTLSYMDGNLSPFSLRKIPTPGLVQKDKDGTTQSWNTFGGGSSTFPQTLIRPCIAFASPLLFLQEGIREIELSIKFLEISPLEIPLAYLQFFLSTLGGWLNVTDKASTPSCTHQCISTVIKLKLTDPPIQAFQKINPDKLESQWPLIKLEFGGFTNTMYPPVIIGLSINVTVNSLKNFQFYNDYGALSTKTPFQLFGPSPMLNSNFIIGNKEIFSKPFDSLIIELNWDQLPDDFAVYYERYNTYIKEKYPPLSPPVSPPLKSIPEPPIPWQSKPIPQNDPALSVPPSGNKFIRFINRLFSKIVNKTTSVKKEDDPKNDVTKPGPFNNECFTVDFSFLQDASWKPLQMNWYQKSPNGDLGKFIPWPIYELDPQLLGKDLGLFVPEFQKYERSGGWVDKGLNGESIFGSYPINNVAISAETCDPSIQNTVQKFTDASKSGFMRMNLTGPLTYGFGSGIYADVVSCIALTNASALLKGIQKRKKCEPVSKPPFSPAAQLPFVPKLTGFIGNYSAKVPYDFTSTKDLETYPLQCFFYTPFTNYLIYDNSKPRATETNPIKYNYTIGKSEITHPIIAGIPLMDPHFYDGYLLLQLDNLLPASSFNIYFELVRNYNGSEASGQIGYYYISKTGWKKLPLLADGTNKFSCSGIITVAVPDDIAKDTPVIPGASYWFCFAVQDPAVSFSQTVFYQSNGFMASRDNSVSSFGNTDLKLAANTIKKPQVVIPQIAVTMQPFASFGGKAAENYTDMNQRISSRILTKNRVVFAGDYPMLIRQEFSDIYFSKAVFDPQTNSTGVYLVKRYSNWTDINAFLPLIDNCTENKIRKYLSARASAFAKITVSSFHIQYVKVFVYATLVAGFEPLDVQQNINHALNIFLSPWISSSSPQVIIGQTISSTMVANLLKTIPGVMITKDVRFQTWGVNIKKTSKWSVIGNLVGESTVAPKSDTALLISSMNHFIQFNK